jgi:hypothetical protein
MTDCILLVHKLGDSGHIGDPKVGPLRQTLTKIRIVFKLCIYGTLSGKEGA